MNATTPRIVDEGGPFAVYVDRHDGRCWSLVGTTPTGIRAGYQEARDRIRAGGTATDLAGCPVRHADNVKPNSSRAARVPLFLGDSD